MLFWILLGVTALIGALWIAYCIHQRGHWTGDDAVFFVGVLMVAVVFASVLYILVSTATVSGYEVNP